MAKRYVLTVEECIDNPNDPTADPTVQEVLFFQFDESFKTKTVHEWLDELGLTQITKA